MKLNFPCQYGTISREPAVACHFEICEYRSRVAFVGNCGNAYSSTKDVQALASRVSPLFGLLFAIIVIEALQQAGITQVKHLLRMTIGDGLWAALCLGIVYAMVTYMGASSVAQLGILNNGAAVLSQVAAFYWGTAGNVLL